MTEFFERGSRSGQMFGQGERLHQHPSEPSTFEGGKPESGYEWLNALMAATAGVQGEVMFITFAVGQAGALFRTAPAETREFIERLEIDVADFREAAELYAKTVEGIIQNARNNLQDREEK